MEMITSVVAAADKYSLLEEFDICAKYLSCDEGFQFWYLLF